MFKLRHMKAKAQEGQATSYVGMLGVWLCYLGVAVMLYILSLGPVMMMVQNKSISPGSSTFEVLDTFYHPLEWTVNKIPPLEHTIGMYLHLWAPKLFDRKGDRVSQLYSTTTALV
jgi:hypothetical protein